MVHNKLIWYNLPRVIKINFPSYFGVSASLKT